MFLFAPLLVLGAIGLFCWLLFTLTVYTAPAVVAGYCATHGITLMAMSSPVWQTIFSVIGAIAVGITTLLRISGMAAFAGPPGRT